MRKAVWALALGALCMMGCKKQVPNDIVQKTVRSALSTHAPATTSAMCGAKVKGIIGATVTVTKKNPDNTGIAHVRGIPWSAPGAPPFCEGDIEYSFTSTSKTSGTRKRRKTTTTWTLQHVKLVAVQTPGVANQSLDEDPDGDDDDDDD